MNCEICKYKESDYEFTIQHTGTMMGKVVMDHKNSINVCDDCFEIKYPRHYADMAAKRIVVK